MLYRLWSEFQFPVDHDVDVDKGGRKDNLLKEVME
jgi:hypothetical protein